MRVEMAPQHVVPKRDVHIYYRTSDMSAPSFRYEVSEDGEEIACMASFVPTFEEKIS